MGTQFTVAFGIGIENIHGACLNPSLRNTLAIKEDRELHSKWIGSSVRPDA